MGSAFVVRRKVRVIWYHRSSKFGAKCHVRALYWNAHIDNFEDDLCDHTKQSCWFPLIANGLQFRRMSTNENINLLGDCQEIAQIAFYKKFCIEINGIQSIFERKVESSFWWNDSTDLKFFFWTTMSQNIHSFFEFLQTLLTVKWRVKYIYTKVLVIFCISKLHSRKWESSIR